MRDVGSFAKDGFSLIPKDMTARGIIGRLKEGERLFVEVWKPRNMNQHRAYFAMLNNVVEASGMWKSREALEYELALTLKRGTIIELRNGNRRFEPDSRKVASMSKTDFERLHHDTVALLTEWLGCDPEMLREEAA
jgi:hypothetical protein